MSKKIADGLHADAAFEQAHGEAMPQSIGGMTEERQSTAVNMALKSPAIAERVIGLIGASPERNSSGRTVRGLPSRR